MNKYITVAAAVAIAIGMQAKAHAADTSNWFASVEVGNAHIKSAASAQVFGPGWQSIYSLSGNETSTAVRFGWRKGIIGFEQGYVNLGSMTGTSAATSMTPAFNVKTSIKGFTSGLNLHFDIRSNFYVEGRGGVFVGKQDVTLAEVGFPSTESFGNTGIGWYAGAGAGYNFNQSWSVGLNYTHYKLDTTDYILKVNSKSDVYGGSLEYRF